MRQHRGMEAETDLVAVARAYFTVLNSGGRNYQAYMAAMKLYLRRHPQVADAEARRDVSALIEEASRIGLIGPKTS
jgi:hypothetical protein